MNLGEVVSQVRRLVDDKLYHARDDVRAVLHNNCRCISQSYDPDDDTLSSLYLKQAGFIAFDENVVMRIGKRLRKCFRVKIFGPFREKLYTAFMVGPIIQK